MTARRRFKRPESVLVVVYTAAGEVLVLRRRRPADFWQSVTGSLRWDEVDPLVAARRELREETGLGEDVPVSACGLINRFPILPAWQARYGSARENLEHVFRAPLRAPVAIVLNPREHSEYLWLPRPEAAVKVTSYTNREAILRLVP